jgi:hypothetical protein
MSHKIKPTHQFPAFSCDSMMRSSWLFVLLLLLTAIPVTRLHAQDPSEIMKQLMDLQEQMAGATDPCPLMPKLKSLINQIASQSPDVYNAMKSSLDLLNSQDDGCKTDSASASPAPVPPDNANPAGKPGSQGICPPSGFVPGVMLRRTSDVSEGVPCKPGTAYGPLIATTASGGYTGVTPPEPAANRNSSGSGGSRSGSSDRDPSDPILDSCIALSYQTDPITGTHLIIQNNCSIAARVYFYASSQVYGAETLDPGAVTNTYASQDKIAAAGGVSIYACPVGDVARQADGSVAYNGVNNHFFCSRN